MGTATDAEVRGLGWMALLEAEVEPVDVSVAAKAKTLSKFGRNPDIDSTGYKTLWNGQTINDEPPLFGDPSLGNVIDTIVSADAGDDQDVYIEGHTKSGDDLTFTSQTVTLNGQTEVALTTPLHTCTRAANVSTTDFTGPVYVFDNTDGSTNGVPTDPSDVAGFIPPGSGQTQLGLTAISSADYFFITTIIAAVNRQQNTAVDVQLEMRSTTGVWRPTHVEIGLHTQGATTVTAPLNPPLIVPPNHYIRFVAQGSSTSATTVSAAVSGYLGAIQ